MILTQLYYLEFLNGGGLKRFLLQPELQAKLDRLSARASGIETPPAVLSTGITEIDSLISGGIPRGAITMLVGPASSGRTTLALSILSNATADREICAVIDTNDTLDPATAQAARIELDQLLWVRCAGDLDHALKATELVLQSCGFGVVVLDIGNLTRKQESAIPSPVWFRFRRAVENSRTSLIVIGPAQMPSACASVVLEFDAGAARWAGGDFAPLLGLDLKVRRRKPAREGQSATVVISVSYEIPE
jgi:recombination protein RecA